MVDYIHGEKNMLYCERCDEPVEEIVIVTVTDNGTVEEWEVCPDCVEIGDGLTVADECI